MRNFKGYVSTNIVGSDRDFEFEVDDDATDEEIEIIAMECMFENIEWSFTEVTN